MNDFKRRLAEIDARVAAVPEPPWAWDSKGEGDTRVGIALDENHEPREGYVEEDEFVAYAGEICWVESDDAAIAEFISHAPADIRWLRSEINRLRNPWVSESAAPAKRHQLVLVRTARGLCGVSRKSDVGDWSGQIGDGLLFGDYVTHYMLIPSAPEEE